MLYFQRKCIANAESLFLTYSCSFRRFQSFTREKLPFTSLSITDSMRYKKNFIVVVNKFLCRSQIFRFYDAFFKCNLGIKNLQHLDKCLIHPANNGALCMYAWKLNRCLEKSQTTRKDISWISIELLEVCLNINIQDITIVHNEIVAGGSFVRRLH